MREENSENAISQSLRGEVIFASQTLLAASLCLPSHRGYRAVIIDELSETKSCIFSAFGQSKALGE